MKAIQYKEHDGFKIVVGEGKLIKDPEASLKQAREAVSRLPVSEELVSLLRQVRRGPGATIHRDDPIIHRIAVAQKRVQLAVLEHARNHPVFFANVPGQELFTDEAAESLLATEVPKGCVLLLDGSLTVDHKWRVYHIKERGRWHSAKIEKIGELPLDGAIFSEALTDDMKKEIDKQTERDVWLKMTDEQVNRAEQTALEAALTLSIKKRAHLEIEKDPNTALKEAKEFYEQEKHRIENRFKEIRNDRK